MYNNLGMALLEHKYKFKIDNPKRGKHLNEERLFRWSNKNFYRTSYNDMRSQVILKVFHYLFRNL